MAESVGGIFVDLGLNQARFQDGLRKAGKELQGFKGRTESLLGGIGKNFAQGLFAGIAAGGLAGIVSQVRDVTRSIAEMGDQARRSGLGLQAFQEWKFVAEQNRIGLDAFVDGFKELNLRADEFIVTGKGPAAEAFARLGYGAEELQRKLKNPSDLMLEIIGRLEKMDKAAQIRIADELFGGTGGERFVELLAQGEKGIRDTITEAHKLGAVMDSEVVAKAAEIDRQFNAIATSVGTNLKGAIVSAAAALSDFIATFRGFLAEAESARKAGLLGDAVGKMTNLPPETTTTVRTTPKTDRLPKAEWTPPAYTPPSSGSGGSAGSRSKSSIDSEREAVARLIEDLEHELALIGMTDEARRASIASREAGKAATDEERRYIVLLNEELHRQQAALEAAQEAGEFFADTLAQGVMDMIPAIETGNEALDRLVNTLIEAVLQASLLGKGPLGGLLGGAGGLLGGLGASILHSGGVAGLDGSRRSVSPAVFAGAPRYHTGGMAGLKPGELPAILQKGEIVLPRGTRLGGAGGGTTQVNMPVTINAQGADPAALRRVEQSVQDLGKRVPSMVDARIHTKQTRNTRA